jgi:hypothetical protein
VTLARSVVIMLLGWVLLGCSSQGDRSKEEGAKLVRSVGSPVLGVEAGRLREQYARAGLTILVPESAWPEGITQLKPREVRVTQQGVFVQRFKEPEEEHGVFIAFPDSRVGTEPDQNPSFTPIDGAAYTYSVRPVKRD